MGRRGSGEGGGGGGEGVWVVIVRGMDDMMDWQGACVRCVLCLSINGLGFQRDRVLRSRSQLRACGRWQHTFAIPANCTEQHPTHTNGSLPGSSFNGKVKYHPISTLITTISHSRKPRPIPAYTSIHPHLLGRPKTHHTMLNPFQLNLLASLQNSPKAATQRFVASTIKLWIPLPLRIPRTTCSETPQRRSGRMIGYPHNPVCLYDRQQATFTFRDNTPSVRS